MATSMAQFYAGRTLFLTGGSGFLGKQMLEKLLRSCPATDQIYVLIRTKKGKSPDERIDQLFQSPLFDRMKVENPNYKRKISAIPGDLTLPGLGISDKDSTKIESNASIFIHNAADVRFGATIRESVEQNLKPARKVLQLAKSCKDIKAYVHVSTAYANTNTNETGTQFIEEKVYDQSMEPSELMNLIDSHDNQELNEMKSKLLDGSPNSYTFTKSMAELLVAKEKGHIPVVILRPSAVAATLHEPFPGWTEGNASLNGCYVGVSQGLMRHVYGKNEFTLDIVPVDLVCNALLCSAKYVGTRSIKENPMVVNFVSSTANSINNREIANYITTHIRSDPSDRNRMILAQPKMSITKNKFLRKYNTDISLPLRAFLLDVAAKLTLNKAGMFKSQRFMSKFQDESEYFMECDVNWETKNLQALQKSLVELDKEVFNFNTRDISWEPYLKNNWLGVKKFILKEQVKQCQFNDTLVPGGPSEIFS